MKQINFKRVFGCLILPVLILVCCILVYQNSEAESKADRVDDVIAYESVLICQGDTLWNIAQENLNQPTDAAIQDYVDEIVSINGLYSAHNIHTGNYILIPRYSSMQKTI